LAKNEFLDGRKKLWAWPKLMSVKHDVCVPYSSIYPSKLTLLLESEYILGQAIEANSFSSQALFFNHQRHRFSASPIPQSRIAFDLAQYTGSCPIAQPQYAAYRFRTSGARTSSPPARKMPQPYIWSVVFLTYFSYRINSDLHIISPAAVSPVGSFA